MIGLQHRQKITHVSFLPVWPCFLRDYWKGARRQLRWIMYEEAVLVIVKGRGDDVLVGMECRQHRLGLRVGREGEHRAATFGENGGGGAQITNQLLAVAYRIVHHEYGSGEKQRREAC